MYRNMQLYKYTNIQIYTHKNKYTQIDLNTNPNARIQIYIENWQKKQKHIMTKKMNTRIHEHRNTFVFIYIHMWSHVNLCEHTHLHGYMRPNRE